MLRRLSILCHQSYGHPLERNHKGDECPIIQASKANALKKFRLGGGHCIIYVCLCKRPPNIKESTLSFYQNNPLPGCSLRGVLVAPRTRVYFPLRLCNTAGFSWCILFIYSFSPGRKMNQEDKTQSDAMKSFCQGPWGLLLSIRCWFAPVRFLHSACGALLSDVSVAEAFFIFFLRPYCSETLKITPSGICSGFFFLPLQKPLTYLTISLTYCEDNIEDFFFKVGFPTT